MKKAKNNFPNWLCPGGGYKEGLGATLILLVIAIIFTWPLALYLPKAIPKGSEPAAVAMFQLFSMEWTGKVLDEGRSYWNAPFFYPFKGAFAWCEPQLFSGILIWLIAKITGYIFAYNIIILLYLVGFGLAGYATARLLSADRLAALWSGIWLTGSAYSLQQICSLSLTAAVFPTGCFYFAFLSLLKKRLRFFWLSALFYILAWFTCKQTAFFLTLLLPVGLWPFFPLKGLSRRGIINFFFALAIILVLVLPYSLAQLFYTQAMGFARALGGVKGVFWLSDLFLPAKGHWLITHVLRWSEQPWFYSWDIGLLMLFTIILSLCLGMVKLKNTAPYQRKIMLGLIAVVGVGLFLGFGPKIGVFIKGKNYSPYSFLFTIIPGLNFIRAPARVHLFIFFSVAVISSYAFAYLRGLVKGKAIKLAVTIFFFLLLFAEMWTMPINLVFPEKEIDAHSGAINWLREHQDNYPVLELPMPLKLRPRDMEVDAGAMLRMLRHGHPVANGYASFFPTAFKQLRKAMAIAHTTYGRRYLDAYGLRYVLVHDDQLSPEMQVDLKKALGDSLVYHDASHSIYLLPEIKAIPQTRSLLPSAIRFSQSPRKGKVYQMRLSNPIEKAVLIIPQSDWRIVCKWGDDSGENEVNQVSLCGSVILDRTAKSVFFQFIRLGKGKKAGRLRLISSQEAGEALEEE